MPCSSFARARNFFAGRDSKAKLCCALLFCLLLLYVVKQEQAEQMPNYVEQSYALHALTLLELARARKAA